MYFWPKDNRNGFETKDALIYIIVKYKGVAMYRNKSKIFEVCNEMLNLMSSDLYAGFIVYYSCEILKNNECFDASIESKASYMKTDKVIIEHNNEELKKLINPTLENEVRLQGMFREEVINIICYYKTLGIDILSKWASKRPDKQECFKIAEVAFKRFDTIKNSETYPFDTLAAQLIVSDCVKGYFDRVLIGE